MRCLRQPSLFIAALLIFSVAGCDDGGSELRLRQASVGRAAPLGESIFPGLTGKELLQQLAATYKPNKVLGYEAAVDKLFGGVDNHGGTLRCVYTGYTVQIPAGTADPSAYAYRNGVDLEHTYPQSKGATGTAKSDMHHMFPVRQSANATRNNNPFAEIDDAQTEKWMRDVEVRTTKPPQNIEEYSEFDGKGAGRFEPRHDHKGHVARAMFYFYTMYQAQADAADPAFFGLQKSQLFTWHQMYPADQAELDRTWAIAKLQENKPNPFVIDPTLVQRAYFPGAALPNAARLNIEAVGPESIDLSWELPADFDAASQDLVVLGRAESPCEDPTEQAATSYSADTAYGAGSRLGKDTFVLYIGDGKTATITGLSAGMTYYFTLWTASGSLWNALPADAHVRTRAPNGELASPLVVSRIMRNPLVEDASGEWFELQSIADHDIDLNGWTIRDDDIDLHVISAPGGLVVPARGMVRLGSNADPATNGGYAIDYQYDNFWLGNDKDEIVLLGPDGTVVDRVAYDPMQWPTGKGLAIAFKGNLEDDDNNDPSFWRIEKNKPSDEVHLVISEIMVDPQSVDDSVGEWFELYNPTGHELDINGWSITDAHSDAHVIDNHGPLLVPAGGRLVLGNNADRQRNGGVAIDYVYRNLALDNYEDEIILFDTDGTEINRVAYDGHDPWPHRAGVSIIFVGAATENNDDPTLWSFSDGPWTGSAGDFGSPGH
jgi:hypothetical protein